MLGGSDAGGGAPASGVAGWASWESSDEGDGEDGLGGRRAPPPELLDAAADAADAAALNDERRRNSGIAAVARGGRAAGGGAEEAQQLEGEVEPPKGASDALLSCPACLATLCVDCQRHVSRRNQFRAMFARNVRVATDVLLRPQEAHNAAAVDEDDAPPPYRPVSCSTCGTQVAVMDADEVLHFYHVIESES